MKKTWMILVLLVLGLAANPALSHTPKGGLAGVAMSPDGKILVAGGDSRVLYLLDPKSYEVKKRIWLRTNIYEMDFNLDGSVLVVEDTKEVLYFIDTATWQIKIQVKDAGRYSAAPAANLVAGLKPGWQKSTIQILSMKDGSLKGKIEYPGPIKLIGLNAQGTRLVAIAEGPRDIEAKKKPPKGLKGFERDKFKQMHDGKTSVLIEYEIPSGKELRKQPWFYLPGIAKSLVAGESSALIIAYDNLNALWQGKDLKLLQIQNSYNYGAGISSDRKAFLTGGLRNGTYAKFDSLKMTTFEIPSLPGWSEYFLDFGFGPDGTGYGVTTAYRLVVITKDGKVKKVVPVY
ncbi:MAG: hypothetical protein PVG03_05915 [Desulfarculaceae bacterium]|jgi:hypothetical protein